MEIKAKTQLQLLIPALGCVGDSWAGTMSQLSHFLLSPELGVLGSAQQEHES